MCVPLYVDIFNYFDVERSPLLYWDGVITAVFEKNYRFVGLRRSNVS